jgi:hypothetical protein
MRDGAPAEPMRPRLVAGNHSTMRSLILLMKFEFRFVILDAAGPTIGGADR